MITSLLLHTQCQNEIERGRERERMGCVSRYSSCNLFVFPFLPFLSDYVDISFSKGRRERRAYNQSLERHVHSHTQSLRSSIHVSLEQNPVPCIIGIGHEPGASLPKSGSHALLGRSRDLSSPSPFPLRPFLPLNFPLPRSFHHFIFHHPPTASWLPAERRLRSRCSRVSAGPEGRRRPPVVSRYERPVLERLGSRGVDSDRGSFSLSPSFRLRLLRRSCSDAGRTKGLWCDARRWSNREYGEGLSEGSPSSSSSCQISSAIVPLRRDRGMLRMCPPLL